MPDFGRGIGGAVEGAAIGSAFPGLGTVIGGVAGFLGGLFGGESEEEVRQRRKKELVNNLIKARADALRREHLLQAGQAGYARQAGAERAAASGRTGADAEAFILPAEGNAISTIGNDILNTEQRYDNMLYNVENEFADRPIEPNAWDYLKEGGKALAEEKLNQDYIDTQRKAPIGTTTTTTPSALSESSVSDGGSLSLDEGAIESYGENPWEPTKRRTRQPLDNMLSPQD